MPGGSQIPSHNFGLSLSSSSSNPPPQPRRHLGGAGVATGPYGPFTGYAAVLNRSRFLGPAQKLLEEICDVGGRPAQLDRCSDDGLLDLDAMDAAGDVGHEMDSSDRAAAEAVTVSGAEQQWRKTRLISLMEEVSYLSIIPYNFARLSISCVSFIHELAYFASFFHVVIISSPWRRIWPTPHSHIMARMRPVNLSIHCASTAYFLCFRFDGG
jgi:hypothetical protein